MSSTIETTSEEIPWEVIKQLRAEVLEALYTNGKIGTAPNQYCVGQTADHDIIEVNGCWYLRVTSRGRKPDSIPKGRKTRTYLKGLLSAPFSVKSDRYKESFEYTQKTAPKVNIGALLLMANEQMCHQYYHGGESKWVCGHKCHHNMGEQVQITYNGQTCLYYNFCIYPPHLVAESIEQARSRGDCCGPRDLSDEDIQQGAVQCQHQPQCCRASDKYFVNNKIPVMYYSYTGKPIYVYRACWDEDGNWNPIDITEKQYPVDGRRVVQKKSDVTETQPHQSDHQHKDNTGDESSEEEEEEEEDNQSVSSDTIANPVSVIMEDEEAETADSDIDVGAADADRPEENNQQEEEEDGSPSSSTESEVDQAKKKLKKARKQLKKALKDVQAAQDQKSVRTAISQFAMYDQTFPNADEMATEELEAATEAEATALTLLEEAVQAKDKAKKAYKAAKKRARKTRAKSDVVAPMKKIEKKQPHQRQVSDRPATRQGTIYGIPSYQQSRRGWEQRPKQSTRHTRSNPQY